MNSLAAICGAIILVVALACLWLTKDSPPARSAAKRAFYSIVVLVVGVATMILAMR